MSLTMPVCMELGNKEEDLGNTVYMNNTNMKKKKALLFAFALAFLHNVTESWREARVCVGGEGATGGLITQYHTYWKYSGSP